MVQLIASDIDGTLLRNGMRQLDPVVFDLILELKKKNILFVASSGRQLYNLEKLFAPVKDHIAFIGENGTIASHNGEIFNEHHIPRDLGQELIQAVIEEPNCEILLSCATSQYLFNPSKTYRHHMCNVMHNNIQITDRIFDVEEPYLKVSLFSPSGTDILEPKFQARFGDVTNMATAGKQWLDMVKKGVSKAVPLQALLNQLHIPTSDCIAFGDQYNDMEMLALVGTSYAMTDAVDGLKAIATHQTDSVENILKEVLAST